MAEFIPRVVAVKDAESYRKEMLALIAATRDGHANLWSAFDARPPHGKCQLPVTVRFAGSLPVVIGISLTGPSSPSQLKLGDVITELDGVSIAKLIEDWRPYYTASNNAARLRDMGRSITRGECGNAPLTIRRESQILKLNATRVSNSGEPIGIMTDDLAGPTFRLLSKDVAYLKLSSVKDSDGCTLHATSKRYERPHHRHPQLSVGLHGVRAWILAGRP